MKFTSLLSVVLVFAISAANAEKEPAILQFLPAPLIFPAMYIIRADLLISRTSHEIVLKTNEPNRLAGSPEKIHGVVDYNQLPDGQYNAVINDNNDSKSGEKTFRIDLTRSDAEFHFEGTSVTDDPIDNLSADGLVRAINYD